MNFSDYRILVVDDEIDILEFISYNLIKEGFSVKTAGDGLEAIELTKEYKPHLIILDIMMPIMDGIEACERIRSMEEMKDVLIAFLTARSEDYSQVAGFEAGADDYIAKPIKPKVLIQRIKALLKRYSFHDESNQDLSTVKQMGDLVIDKERHLVILKGMEMELPKKEFNLLALLTSRPSKVFTREEIFEKVWGIDVLVGDRTIDVYIRKLREKIGDEKIKTIKGVGYKFEQVN